MRKGVEMPDARVILGGLDPKAEWPPYECNQRSKYLRETAAHADFLFHFTRTAITHDIFKQKATKQTFSTYAGASLEAFMLEQYVKHYKAWYENCTKKNLPPAVCVETGTRASNNSELSDEESDTETESPAESGTPTGTSTAGSTSSGSTVTSSSTQSHKGRLYDKLSAILRNQREDVDSGLSSFEDMLLLRFREDGNKTPSRQKEVTRTNDLDMVFSDEENWKDFE